MAENSANEIIEDRCIRKKKRGKGGREGGSKERGVWPNHECASCDFP